MINELFQVPIQLSPRLAWFKNHNVRLHFFSNEGDDPQNYNHCSFGHWFAYVGRMPNNEDDGIWACGETEDEALVNLSKGMKWKLWNEETSAAKPLNAK